MADVTTEIVPAAGQLFAQLLASLWTTALGEVAYINNERDAAAFAINETQIVRDALNNRARSLSLSGDMHEYKVRVRTEDNKRGRRDRRAEPQHGHGLVQAAAVVPAAPVDYREHQADAGRKRDSDGHLAGQHRGGRSSTT